MERQLYARTETPVALDDAVAILAGEPGAVLATDPDPDAPPGCFVSELSVEIAGSGTARQPVVVELGPAVDDGDRVRWSIRWHPVLHERLLPDFAGVLEVRRTAGTRSTLVLEGSYRPPLGQLGKFGDGVIGHRVARSCAASFVADLGRRLAATASGRARAGS